MKSTNVNLLKHQLPIFPDRCVVCDVERPGRTMKLSDRTLTLWSLLFWRGGKKVVIHVPACRWCGWRLRLRYLLEFVFALTVFATLAIWVYPLIPHWGFRWLRTIMAMVVFFVALIPFAIVRLYFPPAFEFDADPDEIEYQFRSARYAEEFRDLNHTWQSIVRRYNPYRNHAEIDDDDSDDEEESGDETEGRNESRHT